MDYDVGNDGNGLFRDALLQEGIPRAELESGEYRARTWVPPQAAESRREGMRKRKATPLALIAGGYGSSDEGEFE